eukprot:XP_001710030.1 Hypothetical protein GL50803_113827 [Giardia lamblia ATCC 50803]
MLLTKLLEIFLEHIRQFPSSVRVGIKKEQSGIKYVRVVEYRMGQRKLGNSLE